MRKYLYAIDPGTTESGVCLVRTEDYKPLACAKLINDEVVRWFWYKTEELGIRFVECDAVIERMQGNNFRVGSDVFLTCEWIGRFDLLLRIQCSINPGYIKRNDEYKAICGKIYSRNDKGISDALVDRFCEYGTDKVKAKGNKKNPGWFYGFSKDVWQSYAQAVAYIDLHKEL